MKNVCLFFCILLINSSWSQVNVFDCGTYTDAVTQAELDAAETYFGSCVLLDGNEPVFFSDSVNKEILAATQIHITDNFHAGGFDSLGGLHLAIAPAADLNVAVMNYADLYSVLRYKKLELGIELPAAILARIDHYLHDEGTDPDELNPFVEWDVDIEATFYNPGAGWWEVVDGFYYREYTNVLYDTTDMVWSDTLTDYPFRVRYAPPRNGDWYCKLDIKINNVIVESSTWLGFNVIERGDPGYVHVHSNKKNVMRGNRMIFPVGQNFISPEQYVWAYHMLNPFTNQQVSGADEFPPDSSHVAAAPMAWGAYLNLVEDYFQEGGKYIRTIQDPKSSLIEFEKRGNYYDRLHYAWAQDKLLDLCEEYDALIQMNLLLQNPFMKYGNYHSFDWDWDEYSMDGVHHPEYDYPYYCYNDNPGVKKAFEMFIDTVDMAYHKQRTRYYIARYGYSTKVYEFELLSEPWHLNELWTDGQDNQGTDAPYADTNNTDYGATRYAIYNYHEVMSEYIKDSLNHFNHLVGMDMAYGTSTEYGGFDASITIPTIDIVGINPYYHTPNKLLTTNINESGENSMYNNVRTIQGIADKPVIIPEGGTDEAYHACSNWTQHPVDVMTLGFTGVAGFNYWPRNEELWPATIRAQNHMNGDDVINTLSEGYGEWTQGREVKKQYQSDNEEPKEIQYYVSQNKELVVGYVRNLTYNVHTKRVSDDCLLGLDSPLDNLKDINWDDGLSQNLLWVKNLKNNTDYQIDWYSFSEGLYLESDCQNTQGDEFKLKHPQLITTFYDRPVIWFVIKQQNCESGMIVVNNNESQEIEDVLTKELEEESNRPSQNEQVQQTVRAYPNPFSDEFIIESEEEDNIEIESADGKVILNTKIQAGSNRISGTYFESGVYLLYFKNQHIIIKMVKK